MCKNVINDKHLVKAIEIYITSLIGSIKKVCSYKHMSHIKLVPWGTIAHSSYSHIPHFSHLIQHSPSIAWLQNYALIVLFNDIFRSFGLILLWFVLFTFTIFYFGHGFSLCFEVLTIFVPVIISDSSVRLDYGFSTIFGTFKILLKETTSLADSFVAGGFTAEIYWRLQELVGVDVAQWYWLSGKISLLKGQMPVQRKHEKAISIVAGFKYSYLNNSLRTSTNIFLGRCLRIQAVQALLKALFNGLKKVRTSG